MIKRTRQGIQRATSANGAQFSRRCALHGLGPVQLGAEEVEHGPDGVPVQRRELEQIPLRGHRHVLYAVQRVLQDLSF